MWSTETKAMLTDKETMLAAEETTLAVEKSTVAKEKMMQAGRQQREGTQAVSPTSTVPSATCKTVMGCQHKYIH